MPVSIKEDKMTCCMSQYDVLSLVDFLPLTGTSLDISMSVLGWRVCLGDSCPYGWNESNLTVAVCPKPNPWDYRLKSPLIPLLFVTFPLAGLLSEICSSSQCIMWKSLTPSHSAPGPSVGHWATPLNTSQFCGTVVNSMKHSCMSIKTGSSNYKN